MQLTPTIPYPEPEKPKLALLESLFREWHQHFAAADVGLDKHGADDMVFDGFYPHYFTQKWRILFIARESRQISGLHNMDVLYPAYREGKRIGDQYLNQNNFHSRMLYVAYGILNGMPEWKDIPYAHSIGDDFGTMDGISFAFMNISKLSNEAVGWQSDWDVINAAHSLSTSSRSFNEEEVRILQPQIVITMGLEDRLASLGELTAIDKSDTVESYRLNSGGHCSLLINTFHFAAWNKNPITDIYLPICDAIKRTLC